MNNLLSEKQKLYNDICSLLLPHARNIQTWNWFDRLLKGNLYPELELVHNIPPLMVQDEITEHDIHWLNCQALNYINTCDGYERAFSNTIHRNIAKIIKLVPDSMRHQLDKQLIAAVNNM